MEVGAAADLQQHWQQRVLGLKQQHRHEHEQTQKWPLAVLGEPFLKEVWWLPLHDTGSGGGGRLSARLSTEAKAWVKALRQLLAGNGSGGGCGSRSSSKAATAQSVYIFVGTDDHASASSSDSSVKWDEERQDAAMTAIEASVHERHNGARRQLSTSELVEQDHAQ